MNTLPAALALGLVLALPCPVTATNGDTGAKAPTLSQLMGLHTQGVNHQLGRGVPQDHAAAAHWYLQSARLGYADSQNDLAKLYDDGRGVPRDEAQAYFWYTLAIEHGNTCAVLDREKLAERMTPAHRAESDALLRAWRDGGAIEATTRLK